MSTYAVASTSATLVALYPVLMIVSFLYRGTKNTATALSLLTVVFWIAGMIMGFVAAKETEDTTYEMLNSGSALTLLTPIVLVGLLSLRNKFESLGMSADRFDYLFIFILLMWLASVGLLSAGAEMTK